MFNAGGLFDASVEFFDIPALLEMSRVIFIARQCQIVGRKICNVAVFGDYLAYQYISEAFQPDFADLCVGQCQVTEGARDTVAAHDPIGLEIADELPSLAPDMLEVSDTGVPGVHEDVAWGKPTFYGLVQHIQEVVVLRAVIMLFPIDAVIHGNHLFAIRPQEIDDADAIDEAMGITAVLHLGKLIGSRVALVQERIVTHEVASRRRYEIAHMIPELARRGME